MYYIITIIIVVLLLISLFSYFSVTTDRRLWPDKFVKENPTGMYPQVITAISDIKYPSDKMFIIKGYNNNDSYTDFPHIFDDNNEREEMRKQAKIFFKKQFGLSDTFLNTFMFELTVNPEINYRAYHNQVDNKYNNKMRDGGFIVFIPPLTRLYGRYGGNNGVVADGSSTLAYGQYKIYDETGNNIYKIIYESQCPLQNFNTYDGVYTPIDCDIKIIKSPRENEIGMKGKAQGINRNFTINSNKKNHILIKNVMTFYN